MTNEVKAPRKRRPDESGGSADPIHIIREGAVSASIWKRQSPSGYSYYDYSLSRSFESLSSGKTGHSKNFFSRNHFDLGKVIEKASKWIAEREHATPDDEVLAA